jgi:hypothetical protein
VSLSIQRPKTRYPGPFYDKEVTMHTWLRCLLAAAWVLVIAAAPAGAHPGFEHYVGVLTAVDDAHVEVKTEKATVSLRVNDQTRYLRKGQDVHREEAKVGVKVVVDARREKGVLVAKEIHFVAETPEK